MNCLVIFCIYIHNDATLIKFLNSIKLFQELEGTNNNDIYLIATGYTTKDYNNIWDYLVQKNIHKIKFESNVGKSQYINNAIEWYTRMNADINNFLIMTIDCDILISTLSVHTLIKSYINLPHCGILAPKQIEDNRHLNTIYQHCYQSNGLHYYWSNIHPSIAGGCWIFSYKIFNVVNGFDNVGCYGPEDVLFAHKVNNCGLRCYMCDDIVVQHPL